MLKGVDPRAKGSGRRTMLRVLPAVLLVIGMAEGLSARAPKLKTSVRVELVTDRTGAPLDAQKWVRVFSRYRIPLRVRREIGTEKPTVTERTSGRIRQVTVIGRLERGGRVLVPGQSFTFAKSTQFGKWLADLKRYGAQGSPEGQPAFGLNAGQFQQLFEILAQPVKKELRSKPLSEAIQLLELPADYPLRYLRPTTGRDTKVLPRTTAKGLSRGTTLAALLQAQGLSFRPRRSPAGRIELVVDQLDPTSKSWPLGWPPRLSRPRTAPTLFKIVGVDLPPTPLIDALEAISINTRVPLLMDHHSFEKRGLDIEKVKVSSPPRRVSWFQLQGALVTPHRLVRHLRIDEAGNPLILITAVPPVRTKRN